MIKEGTNQWLQEQIHIRAKYKSYKPITTHFIEDISINFYENEISLNFTSCTFEKNVFVSNNTTGKSDILFQNCTFLERAEFKEDLVTYEECTFTKELKLNLAQDASFSLSCENNTFLHSIHLNGNNSALFFNKLNDSTNQEINIQISGSINSIFINNCIINIIICNINKPINSIDILNSTIKHSTKLFESILQEVNIINTNFESINSFGFSNTLEKLDVSDSYFFKLEIKLTNIRSLSIYSSKIDFLKITGELKEPSKCVIEFKNDSKNKFNLKDLCIEDVRILGNFKISDAINQKGGLLIISNSDLGKSNIVNCDFHSAEFHFSKSKIYEAFLFHTSFPKIKTKGFNKTQYLITKELYGQLALAYSNMGDHVDSQEFHSREIESFFYSLKWHRNPLTKFNLSLNLISNKFGKSWSRGVIFTLVISLSFYISLIISTNEYLASFPNFDSSLIPGYIRFMNPFRTYELEKVFLNQNITLSHYSYIIDFIGRIFITYGYYQTIQAFRRFGKN